MEFDLADKGVAPITVSGTTTLGGNLTINGASYASKTGVIHLIIDAGNEGTFEKVNLKGIKGKISYVATGVDFEVNANP